MKFWYSILTAILLSTLSWFNLEQLQDAFVPHQNITALESSENAKDEYGLPSKDTQEGKDEEKNKDSEEDNNEEEEKDSEEEKRENESKQADAALSSNCVSYSFFYTFLPKPALPREYISKEINPLEVPLYLLYTCLKINC